MKKLFKKLEDSRYMVVDICLLLLFGTIFVLEIFNQADKKKDKK